MAGLDYKDWRNDALWLRSTKQEDKLYYDVLGLTNGAQYNLISLKFGSNFESTGTVSVQNGLPNVELRNIDGFSLFDWAKVFMQATTIHMVSSACFYLLDLLQLSTTEVHLYSRNTNIDPQLDNIRYLMTKPYVLHENYIPCRNGFHLFGGLSPFVDPAKHEVQNPGMIGKPCDCGKLTIEEGECACPNKKDKWEIKWKQA